MAYHLNRRPSTSRSPYLDVGRGRICPSPARTRELCRRRHGDTDTNPDTNTVADRDTDAARGLCLWAQSLCSRDPDAGCAAGRSEIRQDMGVTYAAPTHLVVDKFFC